MSKSMNLAFVLCLAIFAHCLSANLKKFQATLKQSSFPVNIPSTVVPDTNPADALYFVTTVPQGDGSNWYYINLQNTNNVSTYQDPTSQPWNSGDSTIVTSWTKVRFDPNTMLINTGDYTYSSSVGQISHWPAYSHQVPFGTAFGCQSPYDGDGIAVIDFTGTNFAVNDTFGTNGYLPGGSATAANNNQVINITGGGYCGWCGPMNAVNQGEEHMHQGGWDITVVVLPGMTPQVTEPSC